MSHTSYRAAARRGIYFVFCALLAPILALAAVDSATAASGDERLEGFLKGLQSLQASFSQVTFNGDHSRMTQARGTFYLKRPGQFRWVYDSPNRQVIVADGKRVYLHDLDLDQISQQSEDKALRGTPALLLADGGPVDRHFLVRPIESHDGRDWVSLTPKESDTEIVRIEIGFGEDGLDSMIMEDSFGQTTRLDFADIRRNPRLDPGLFKMDQKTGGDFLSFD